MKNSFQLDLILTHWLQLLKIPVKLLRDIIYIYITILLQNKYAFDPLTHQTKADKIHTRNSESNLKQ